VFSLHSFQARNDSQRHKAMYILHAFTAMWLKNQYSYHSCRAM